MLIRSRYCLKLSAVTLRNNLSEEDLSYSHGYSHAPLKYKLSQKYDTVNDKNRFISLKLLFDRISGYVGRRQYKLKVDLKPLRYTLEKQGIDWFDLKEIASDQSKSISVYNDTPEYAVGYYENALFITPLEALFTRLNVPPSHIVIIMTILEQRICGVITRVPFTGAAVSCCMAPGLEIHGWRCGKNGHLKNVYFEHKDSANDMLILEKRSRVYKFINNGVTQYIHNEPDFQLDGRAQIPLEPLRQWRQMTESKFDIITIGYDFRIHPNDPRVQPQIVDVANEWDIHAEAIRLTLLELLNQKAVVAPLQNLEIVPGEIDLYQRENTITDYKNQFTEDAPIHIEKFDNQREKYFIKRADGTIIPWFQPPESRVHNNNIPDNLPFCPTIIIKATISYTPNNSNLLTECPQTVNDTASLLRLPGSPLNTSQNLRDIDSASHTLSMDLSKKTTYLNDPLLKMTCMIHSDCCAQLNQNQEEELIEHVLEIAKKVPFAVPFYLYYRIDPIHAVQSRLDNNTSKDLVNENSEIEGNSTSYFQLTEFGKRRHQLLSSKYDTFFNITKVYNTNSGHDLYNAEFLKDSEHKANIDQEDINNISPEELFKWNKEADSVNPADWD